MPITHTTIPVPPAQVGEAEWAEAHTLPTAGEVGAITTGSVETLLVPYLTSASASTVYARQESAVTTAQLSVYLTSASAESLYATQASAVTTAQLAVYLLSQDASTTYARQASAVTTAQLSVYLTSASADSLYARQASAVTTAQLAVYLLSQDASTTYARQASAVTTAQLSVYLTSASAAGIYLTSASASTVYARQVSAVTTAQLAVYLLSQDASTTYARQTSAVTTAQLNNISAGAINAGTIDLARLGSAGVTSTTTFLRGDNTWAEPPAGGGGITQSSGDARYGTLQVVTADVSSATIATLVTVSDLIYSVSASTAYRLEYMLVYRSSATATNIGVGVSVTPTPSTFMVGADIYAQANDGTAAVHSGYASANGDIIIGTTTNLVADLPMYVNATIVTGAAGQVQLIFRTEVSNSNVVIRRGSSLRAVRLGAV